MSLTSAQLSLLRSLQDAGTVKAPRGRPTAAFWANATALIREGKATTDGKAIFTTQDLPPPEPRPYIAHLIRTVTYTAEVDVMGVDDDTAFQSAIEFEGPFDPASREARLIWTPDEDTICIDEVEEKS